MKILLIILALYNITNFLYSADNQQLLIQKNQSLESTSHTRSSSIQTINSPRSTEVANSLQTTVHILRREENNLSNSRGYTAINIPDENSLGRADHEQFENRTKQCKLCGIFCGGVGIIYFLISSISKHI